MKIRSLVVVHLAGPSEKFFGVLEYLGPEGVTVRGVSLPSFEDWVSDVAAGRGDLGPTTVFVPMFRVERIFVDEQVGEVESYSQRFWRLVGRRAEELLLPLEAGDDGMSVS